MKNSLLSVIGSAGVEITARATKMARLIVAFLVAFLGGLAVQAAAPVLTLPATVTVAEDATTNLAIGVTDSAVPIFTVTTTATSSDTNLVSNSSLVFSGFGTNRLLAIRPGQHLSGTATITVVASDSQPASTTNTFTLNVTFTNYPPVFVSAIANQTNNENSPALVLPFSISDIETANSNLIVTATSSNTTLLPNSGLVITNTGTNCILTVTPATNQNGMTLVELIVTDGGGATATNDFILNVWAVNQPPTFTMLTNDVSYHEWFGAVTIPNFITSVSSGPANQSSESNWFTLQYTTNFFQRQPALSTNGTLSFTVLTNVSGTNTITFVLHTTGSTTNGGVNTLSQVLTLEVPAIVQPPYFALATNFVAAAEESLTLTNLNFVSARSNGPTNKASANWSYTLTTVSTNSTNATFTSLALATNGTLTFRPATHSFGTNTVQVVMTVLGANTNGWMNTYTNTFQIGVAQINHAPVIAWATNRTVLENATNVTAPINVWSYDQQTNFVLTATSSNTSLATVTVVTNSAGTSNVNYTLNLALATNNSGTAVIHLVATEGSLSSSTNFTLTVTLVNHAPSFTLATNWVTAPEESAKVTNTGFVTAFSKGPANQNSATFTYTLTTSTNSPTNAVFTTLALATNGVLTFQPKAHSYGTNAVQVVMTITGGTANGGVNSATNNFQIGISQTQHAPTIVGATNRTVLENATNGLTAAINVWDYDLTTNLNLTATSSNTSVATVSVATNSAGVSNVNFTLTFALATNASGVVPIQLVATRGSLSTTNSFNLTVTLVNHAPSFTLATNFVTATEETTAVSYPGFVTALSRGPANQSSETYTFTTTAATNSPTNAAFTSLSLGTNGTLSFLPKAHSFGTNTITVVMTISGGNANGGVNTCTNTFQIGVAQTNHAPTIVGATNRTVLENAVNPTALISVWDYDLGTNFVLTATSANTNLATVSVATNSAGASNVNYTLSFALVTNNSGTSTIQLVATAGSLSTTNSFILTVGLVNHGPVFTLATNWVPGVEETAKVTVSNFVSAFSKGPANQNSENFTYTLTASTNGSTNATFTTLTLATNGTLSFQPKAHSYGTNTITAVMALSGGNANGGVNTYTNTFQIGIAQTNHAPTIAGATNRTVVENAGPSTASINVWDYDQQSSNFNLTAVSMSNGLATVSVTGTNVASLTNVVYTLTLSPVSNANGAVTIQLVASEGSLATTNSFTLTISAVSKSPSFTLATNFVAATEETAPVTNAGFVTGWKASKVWRFTATTDTSSPTNVAFTTLPAVDTNGTLTFAPAPHTFGTNWVTLVMTDTTNYFTNMFQIGVAQTNHAPVIGGATNLVALENATNSLTAAVNVWDYDLTTNFVFTATSLSNSLASVTVRTNAAGVSNVNYTLTFTLVQNANGTAPIQLVASEGSLSTTNSFTLTITPVDQAPSYTFNTNDVTNNVLTVPENAGLVTVSNFMTNLLAGPANEIGQTWVFTVTSATNNPTNATFAQFPAVDTNGTLTFATATNSFGTNSVKVVMTDSGDNSNNGTNAYTNSFQLKVTQVQYPPAFSGITNVTILENATTNLTLAFTLYDPLTTNFTVTSVSSDTNLVKVTNSGVGTSRLLTFAPKANSNGVATITLTAGDGTLTNTTNFTLTIPAVNQAPSFTLVDHAFTVDNFGARAVLLYAVTNISAGPPNESSQTVSFVVTNNNTNLFLVQPVVDASTGNLIFTPGTSPGTAIVSIQAMDDGGTNNGGTNASAIQTMTITVPPNAFQYLVGPYAGLFYNTNGVTNASSGYFSLTLTTNGAFAGYFLCAGSSNIFNGQFSISQDTASVTAGNFKLNLSIDTSANWTESISGTVSNTAAHWNSSLQSYLVGYSASFPTPLAGPYTMSLPGLSDPTKGPEGDSIFTLALSDDGFVTLAAFMADNTAVSQSSLISQNGLFPLYLPLYNNGSKGILMGWLDITGDVNNSVSANPNLTWFNQTGATIRYASGFTNQSAPLAASYDSALSNLLYFSNGAVVLTGGNLSAPITNLVTISNNTIIVDPTATNQLSLSIVPSTGEIVGSFMDPSRNSNYVHGILLQSTTNLGRGYFLGSSQDGLFTLVPAGPSIDWATNHTILENATSGLTATFNVRDADAQSGNFALTATSLSPGLASVSVTGSSIASTTNVIFTLTFAPVTNADGPVTIQLSANQGGIPYVTNFTLNITPIGLAPSFTLNTNFVQVTEETASVTNAGFVTAWASSAIWTFTATTTTNSPGNANLTVLPAVDTNGTLTFSPAPHSFGTNSVSLVMTDTTNYFTNTFQIGIAQTNHAPVIVTPPSYTVLENAANGTATINVWDYDQNTNLLLTAPAHSAGLASAALSAINVLGTSNVSYTLTLVPVHNANGPATVTLVGTAGPLSTTNTFSLTITPVDQAPSYSFTSSDMTNNALGVAENAGLTTIAGFATGMSPGPANESSQTWTFTVTPASGDPTNVTFLQAPTITPDGTLAFQTDTNAFGTNLMTVTMTDSGDTSNNGTNTYTSTFELDVAQVMYAPAITGISNVTILENQSSGLTLPFDVYDHLAPNFTVTCSSSDSNLVTASVSGTGRSWTLTFAPVVNSNGVATISLTAGDGFLTTSTNFTLTILPVNQAPTFNLNVTSITVDKYGQQVSWPNAVTGISAGPLNEASQTVTLNITNSSPGSFTVQPAIDGSGTLTFTPGTAGATVTVGVQATDSGDCSNGGTNGSVLQTFTITIPPNGFAPLAGSFAGLFYDNGNLANASSGYFSAVLATDGSFNGYLLCAGDSNIFNGQFSIGNNTATVTALNYNLSLSIDTSGGTRSISGSVSNTVAGWNSTLTSYLAGYSDDSTTSLAGGYTMAIPGLSDPTVGPTGDSIFSLIVSNNGKVSLAGFTADNTNGAQLSQISTNGWYPLYVPLYNNGVAGTLFGWLDITGQLTNSVVANPNLTWFDETGATTLYPNGFTNQSVPLAAPYNPSLANLFFFSSGMVTLSGGSLVAPITNAVTISGNTITVDPSATDGLSLTLIPSSGEIVGYFLDGNSVSNYIHGVILQNSTNSGRGYFEGDGQEGSFVLSPVSLPPSFSFAPSDLTAGVLTVAENAGLRTLAGFATSMNSGLDYYTSQTWTFAVTYANGDPTNVSFSQDPTLDPSGTLVFKTATNSFGTNAVMVVMTDVAANSTYTNTFELDVTQVPYPPVYTGVSNVTMLENDSAFSLPVTIYDPLTNNFVVNATTTDSSIATVSVTGDGTTWSVLLSPAANANGSVTIGLSAVGLTLTGTTNFTLNVLPVNQAPSFNVPVSTYTVDHYNIAVSVPNAVTAISAGPANESTQTVSFNVTNSNPGSFSVQPAIDASGTLTFTPKETGQTVTVGIQAVDSGDCSNGGTNASSFQPMTITIPPNAFAALAGSFAGLFYNTNSVTNASTGYFSAALTNDGTVTGYILCAGGSNTFSGQLSIGSAAVSVTNNGFVYGVTLDTSAKTLNGSVSKVAAGWNSTLVSYLAGYSDTSTTTLAGGYTMAIPGLGDSSVGPGGDSIFSLILNTNGAVNLAGFMADGTIGLQTSQISTAGLYPVYVPLYANGAGGVLFGWLGIVGGADNSVTANPNLTWFNTAGATAVYPSGFRDQATPVAAPYDPSLASALTFSSGSVILSGGGLSTSITNLVTISGNVITVDESATDSLTLTINASTGQVTGSFTDPDAGSHVINGIIMQNTINSAQGYFLGTSEDGYFELIGN